MKKHIFFLFMIIFPLFCDAEDVEMTPHQNNQRLNGPVDIAISAVFQHEAEWLKEWIEFHRMIGVEHFYLYNNLSNDDYLSILEPYINRGIVELFEFPKAPFVTKDQASVYNHSLTLAKEDNVKWLAIIDTDEFITPIQTKTLGAALESFDNYPGLYARWHIFGTSNVEHLNKKELLIEKLVHRTPENHRYNKWGKSIVQPHLTRVCVNPHTCSYLNSGRAHNVSVAILRINHYYFRTEEFLRNVKIPRLKTRRSNGVGNITNYKTIFDFLKSANKIPDFTMQDYVVPLKKRVFRRTIPEK